MALERPVPVEHRFAPTDTAREGAEAVYWPYCSEIVTAETTGGAVAGVSVVVVAVVVVADAAAASRTPGGSLGL